MYEDMTYDVILDQMLERVPDTMDKREGSIIYDAIAPAAIELANMYIELDTILNQTFADTSTDIYLDKRVSERGITRTAATFAIVEGIFTPTSLDVTGQRFNCGEYNYTVIEATDVAGTYKLKAETSGTIVNGVSGQLIPINYIQGLETAEISQILIPGEDAETDDELRKRYYDSLKSQAYGGNIADYEEKTKSIDGVGGVKVTPVWNGGGTVKLTIIASDFSVPTSTLVDNVQTIIDPIQNQGEGVGLAPVGHTVTVEGVEAVTVNISTEITYQSGWNWESVEPYVNSAIDAYFNELSETWEDTDNLIIRISQIETRLLSCTGILDIANTTINESASNLQLDSNCIAVRGVVSGT